MQNKVIAKICESIVNQLGNTANLRLKIHPTAESLENYKEILSTIEPPVGIIQKDDLLFLVNASDMIISFGNSSELFGPLLLNRPIYIMNLLHEDAIKNLYLKENVTIEYGTVDDLINKN